MSTQDDMGNNNKQIGVIRYIPNNKLFRNLIRYLKIKNVYRYSLDEVVVEKAENDKSFRNELLDKLKKKSKDYLKIQKKIDSFYDDNSMPQELLSETIKEDMIFAYFAYGFEPNEYFAFRLDKKSFEERQEFISNRLRQKYRCQMNNILRAYLFNDKYETYKFFNRFYKRNAISIENEADYDKFTDFIGRYPVFVKKQVYLAQGNSVELVDINSVDEPYKYFSQLIAKGKHILEDRIVQSSYLEQFNSSSVNTVRAITFYTNNGIVVPYCILRTGRDGGFVDNSGAGGVQSEIDYSSGKIVSDGYDEQGGIYKCHPTSGKVFKGSELPDWNQLKSLVTECAQMVPQIKFIGWDLAHTDDGWVLVEGNENCYIIALQQIRDKGMKSDFEALMKDMQLYS